ncbi:MAG: hypothetical protein D6689_07460 [Deltaproteobacteria bacterium]|nr:MAG: hypothetical protein D6689_07460 [Deltaproteobacteria bacterium]
MKASLVTTALLALSATAYAQAAAPPPAPAAAAAAGIVRRGVTFGFGVGAGSVRSDFRRARAASLSLRLGAAVTPHAVLVAELATSAGATASGDVVAHRLVGAQVIGFPTRRLYLGGGIGRQTLAISTPEFDYESDAQLGVIFTAGFEVVQVRNFGLSLELHGYRASFGGSPFVSSSLGAAFTWF